MKTVLDALYHFHSRHLAHQAGKFMISRFTGIATTAIAALALLRTLSGEAAYSADTSHCYQIQDRDRKNFCLAQAKDEASYCYQIQDRDMKNVCLAQTKSERSYCYQIQERDLKNQCLSLF